MLQKLFYSIFYFVFTLFIVFWLTATFFLTPITNLALKDFDLSLKDGSSITFDPVQIALDVRKFGLMHHDQELLGFDHFIADVALFPLLKGDITLHQVVLNGLETSVKMADQKVFLNDVDVVSLFAAKTINSEPPEHTQDPEPGSKTEPEKKPLTISLKKLRLNDIQVNYQQEQLKTALTIDQYKIDDLIYNDKGISLETALKATTDLTLNNALNLPNDSVHVSFATELETHFDLTQAELMAVSLSDLSLVIKELKLQAAGYNIANQFFELVSDEAHLELEEQQPKSLQAELNVKQESLTIKPIKDNSKNGETVTLGALSLTNVTLANDISAQKFTPNVTVEQIVVSALESMIDPQNDRKLLSLESLIVESVFASQETVDINSIVLGRLHLDATLDKAKNLTPMIIASTETAASQPAKETEIPNTANKTAHQPPSSLNDAEAQKSSMNTTQINTDEANKPKAEVNAAQEAEAPFPQFALRLGSFNLDAPAEIRFVDMSVSPTFSTDLLIETMSLTEVNSSKPELASALKFNATQDQYTKIIGAAELRPFLPIPQYNANLSVNELSLPELSPYVRGALGYNIESGQFDTKVDVKINGKILSGNSLTHLKSIELSALEDSGEKNNLSGGAISFNAALGMLKDGDDIVELDIPIKGDLDKPSVGLSGIMTLVVKQATMSAAKDYLITSFLPYSKVIKIAMSASDHLLKVNFEPLEYQVEQIKVNSQQEEYLSQLSAALKQNKGINIKLCPVAASKELPGEDKTQRLELAQKRGAELKRQLVEEYKVASKRLYSCSAKIDTDKKAKARVEIEQL